MSDKWLGIVAASDKIKIVHMEIDGNGHTTVLSDEVWKMQNGDRPEAYRVMHERIENYISELKINHVAIKASAVSLGGTKKAHLEAAELRGVVMAACKAANAETHLVSKAHLSRNYGNRKADEYLKDDDFWDDLNGGSLSKRGREPALLILSAAKL